MVWTLPTMPSGWRIVLLRREGADISAGEVTNYFADPANPPSGVTDIIVTSDDFPGGVMGISDYEPENNLTYYYKAILQDSSDDAVSTTASANALCKKTVETKIIDAKKFVLEAVERVMKAYGMTKDQHYELLREYALPGMQAPILYVTRVGGRVLHQYMGYFRQIEADLKNTYGELEMDNIQVVWEDPNPIRRDSITNMFRESKEFIRQFLIREEGGDMEWIEMLIEGDVINEAVRDRVQVGGMMIISCAISSEVTLQPNLASWIAGEGEPQN